MVETQLTLLCDNKVIAGPYRGLSYQNPDLIIGTIFSSILNSDSIYIESKPSCEGATNFGFRLLRRVIQWTTDGRIVDLAYSRQPQNLRAHLKPWHARAKTVCMVCIN